MDDVRERRARLVRRQLTAGPDGSDGPDGSALGAARSVVALHATDPATVYLSVLARCPALTLDDVGQALYADRTLVRLMAMRRTLFVVPADLAPVVHAAAALDVAVAQRRRLLTQLATLPTDPALPPDLDTWLRETEDATVEALVRLGTASGAQLARAVPRLRTALLPTTDKAYDVRRTVASQVLVLLGLQGRLVRGRPQGSWTSRQHVWEPASPPAPVEPGEARTRLVEEYLRRFGPATEADVTWWTGWPKGTTRRALAGVDTAPFAGGLVLAGDEEPVPVAAPTAVLLPALDPTPMGWQERGWFLPADPGPLYDRSGNVGPTVWWDGEVIGGWAVRPDGSVAHALLVDRGSEARQAVAEAAEVLTARLGGAVVVPSFRTPLERQLSG